MKILVPIKRVIDPYVNVRVRVDHTSVETNNIKMAMNPFDEIAVEEAVRLKEAGLAKEILVVSIGTDQSQETLRTALALGADRALLIRTKNEIEPLNIAKILVEIVKRESPNLIILGKQSIDGDHNQTGQMLAGLLNWPQATFASAIKIENDFVIVTREVDGGLETLKLKLPAVITTDLRLNIPRYATLPNIMKSKQKPLETLEIDTLDVDLNPRLKVLEVMPPSKRSAGIKVSSVAELVDKLKNEAKVIL